MNPRSVLACKSFGAQHTARPRLRDCAMTSVKPGRASERSLDTTMKQCYRDRIALSLQAREQNRKRIRNSDTESILADLEDSYDMKRAKGNAVDVVISIPRYLISMDDQNLTKYLTAVPQVSEAPGASVRTPTISGDSNVVRTKLRVWYANTVQTRRNTMQWMGDLASAVEYLQRQHLRHSDRQPLFLDLEDTGSISTMRTNAVRLQVYPTSTQSTACSAPAEVDNPIDTISPETVDYVRTLVKHSRRDLPFYLS